jgi:putative heme iron utilization protein
MSDAMAWTARKLVRAARSGTLATVAQGQPFASLITPATAPDLSVLLLLSDLSEHTRHLREDPRCAVLMAGEPESANPQTTPRVTLTGRAEAIDDPALRARYLAVHPYAALYADFGDFHLWRMRFESALFVGGFGKAARLGAGRLAPDPNAVAAITEAESAIIAEWNHNRPNALARVGGEQGDWRLMAVDVDGCHVGSGERVVRLHWSGPIGNVADAQRELALLLQNL